MKTFKVKSSAVRAAKQAGLVVNESAEIIQNEDGSWSFVDRRPVGAEDLLDDEFPVDGPELDAYGEEVGEVEDLDVTGGDWDDRPNQIKGENLGLNTTRCPSCHREGHLETESFKDAAGLPQTKITCNHCGWFHSEISAQGEEKPFEEITEKEHRTHRHGEVGNKSSTDKPCSKVWDIAAALHKDNPQVKRKEVLEACLNAGIAFYTARTQYQEWYKASKNSK
jgi:hypothetical protein